MISVPSGRFQFEVREANFGDQKQLDSLSTNIVRTYTIGAPTVAVQDETSESDVQSVQIWAVTTDIFVPNASQEKGAEAWVPAGLARTGKRYARGPFMEWLEEQGIGDVLAMHKAVLEANPTWNPASGRA